MAVTIKRGPKVEPPIKSIRIESYAVPESYSIEFFTYGMFVGVYPLNNGSFGLSCEDARTFAHALLEALGEE